MKFSHLFAGIAALVLFWGCENASQPTNQPNALTDSTATTPVKSGSKLRKKILAKGILRNGKELQDFQLQEEYLYDSLGYEIQFHSHFDGFDTQIETVRDAEGRELSKVRTARDQTGKLEYRISWNGDHTEQLEEEFSARESRVVNKFTRKFDANGKLLSLTQEDLHLVDYPMVHTITYDYDSQGRLVSENEKFGNTVVPGSKHIYDVKGNLIQIDRFDSEGKVSQSEIFAYDAAGKRIERKLQDHSGFYKTPQLAARYEYDAQGRVLKEIQYQGVCTEEGQAGGKCPISETKTYTYDAEGRIATIQTVRTSPMVVDMLEKMEYSFE